MADGATPPPVIRAYPPANLTREEAMYLAGLQHRSTFDLWVRRGWLPAGRRLGRRVFWHRDSFMAAIDRLHQLGKPLADEPRANRDQAVRKARRQAKRRDRGVA